MGTQDNQTLVANAFAEWAHTGDVRAFFELVDDRVLWTVLGTCPVSGTYKGKTAFVESAAKPVFERLAAPLQPKLRRLIGEHDWVVLQWFGEAPTKDDSSYKNEFCWVMRIENSKIVECIAYFDTQAAAALLR